jgi:hypothetical protein
MGIAPLAKDFAQVRSVRRTATGIRLSSSGGGVIDHVVDTGFLQ